MKISTKIISIGTLILILTFFSFYFWGLNKAEELLKIWGNTFVGLVLIHYGFEFYKKQKEFDRSTEIVKGLINDYSKQFLKVIRQKTPILETMKILDSSFMEGEKRTFFKLTEVTRKQRIDS